MGSSQGVIVGGGNAASGTVLDSASGRQTPRFRASGRSRSAAYPEAWRTAGPAALGCGRRLDTEPDRPLTSNDRPADRRARVDPRRHPAGARPGSELLLLRRRKVPPGRRRLRSPAGRSEPAEELLHRRRRAAGDGVRPGPAESRGGDPPRLAGVSGRAADGATRPNGSRPARSAGRGTRASSSALARGSVAPKPGKSSRKSMPPGTRHGRAARWRHPARRGLRRRLQREETACIAFRHPRGRQPVERFP